MRNFSESEDFNILFIETEESYTSKASFLDMDIMPVFGTKKPAAVFSGRRIKRGLYRASDGRLINADVNGGLNITRKVFPNAFANGIDGVWEHPVRCNIACFTSRKTVA